MNKEKILSLNKEELKKEFNKLKITEKKNYENFDEKCFACDSCDSCVSCKECIECIECIDCTLCEHCLSCVGIKDSKYMILNVQFTEEEYFKKLDSLYNE